jgi:predicted acetyltransferase
MDHEYREVPEADADRFGNLLAYAFRPEAGHPAADPDEDRVEYGDERGLYDGDDLLAVCRHYWFDVRVRGEFCDVPGLSAVASPPEHRHRGLVAALLRESLVEYRERGSPFSALWPFDYPFYARYGWDTCSRWATVECDPEALAFTREAASGNYRMIDADDWATVDAIYAAARAGEDLALDREEGFWRARVFQSWETDPFVYVWEADGDARGYLVYVVEEEDDGKRLTVYDWAAVDEEASQNLLRFCYQHDSQVDTVWLRSPPDVPLMDRANPEDLDVSLKHGPLMRFVDVVDGVEALSYPAGASGSLVVDVDDPLVDWHDDPVSLTIENGLARAERVDETPDVETDVGTLTQVAVGYRSVADANRAGDLEGGEGARETLAALFPPTETDFREFF